VFRVPALIAVALVPLIAAAQSAGAALYAQHCAICHQVEGGGTVGLAPSLKGDHWVKLGADRSYLVQVIVHGLAGPIKLGGQTFVGAMPGLGPQLDDASLAAIATHVRQLQGARDEAAYTAADIKAVRAAPGGPSQTRALRQKLLP